MDANFGESQNAITGSVVIEDQANYYKCYLFFLPGEIQFYDKRHLFTLAGEDEVYTAGDEY
jgi:predicted amidohydrolase